MSTRTCILIALTATLLLGLISLAWAPLNQDEGWYLLSARRTAEGAMPYRDYAFTQGPVFPYVYGCLNPLVRRAGLAGGRAATLLLGWASIAVTAWTVYRVRRRDNPWLPLCVVIVLLGLNTFQAQYLATVKTYSLATLFLAGGLGCILRHHRGGGTGWLAGGALFLALAAGTRLSLALFLPAIGLEFFFSRAPGVRAAGRKFLFLAPLFLAIVFLPFLLAAPEGALFGWFEYHTGRETGNPLLLRAAFASRVLRNYLPFALAALPLLLRRGKWTPGLPGIAVGAVAVTLLHAFSPFPYDDYQTAVMPAFALVLALQLPAIVVSPERRRQACVGLTLFGLMFAAASPQWQDWFSAGRDRIWWKMSTRPPLALLQDTARRVRGIAPGADVLFTPDAYLAIETGLDVPVELNMGPFGFFPDMDTERAERLHVLNTSRLLELIRTTDAPVAALSGYAFTIQAPGITPTPPDTLATIHTALERRFRHVDTVDGFGQARTRLEIYLPD